MKKIYFALLASAATLTGVAHAEGAYVGASASANRYSFDVPNATSSGNSSGDKAAGKIFAGYDLDKTWAIEGGYADFGSNSYNYTNILNGASGNINTASHAFYVTGKATLPVTNKIAVYGKLGVAALHDSASGSGDAAAVSGGNSTGLYSALGTQFAINKKVSLTAEYENYGQSSNLGRKAGAFSLGARYHF